MSDANNRIGEIVKSNEVVLFMKGTPLFPQCGFSSRAITILEHLGVPFESVDVLQDPEIRQGIKEYSDWPTIPQLYVKGEFVGGSDIMLEMFQSGELQQLVSAEQLLKFPALEHLHHDVGSTDELALHVELRDGRPIRIILDALADLRILQHVDRLEGDAEMVEDRDRAAGEAALREERGALHEEDDVALLYKRVDTGVDVGHLNFPTPEPRC